ncbi:adhesion G-protein coupled receptor G5-like [Anguilla rostrata]|uniref:adhesion G-protein coupled receptor G5-like n=1 Tax=Anguilla rostrata TaxID=7938 RepID=UPI0030CE4357
MMERNDCLLLVDDGYTGPIRFKRNDPRPEHSQGGGNDKKSSNQTDRASILSLDTTKTGVCYLGNLSEDYNITIKKDGQSYHIYLLKKNPQVNGPFLCFVPGNCSVNSSGQPGEGAIQLNSPKTQFKFSETLCKNHTENEIIIYNISFIANKKGNESTCLSMDKETYVTCKNPVEEPKLHLEVKDTIIVSANGEVDATAAMKAMKSLPSLLNNMRNEDSARITMGPIKGILKKQDKKAESEFKEVSFGLTTNSDIQVIGDITALEHTFPGLISIPKEAFEKANLSSSNEPFAAVFRFPNLTKDANNSKLLNSEAIAIEMAAEIKNLTDVIKMTFIKVQDDVKMSCRSWNGEGNVPVWTTDGCYTFESNDTVSCQCTHLTFFAILMVSPGLTISSSDLTSLTYITYIGCGMSMFFLGVALFMHFLLRRAKANYATLILMNLFIAMFLLNLFFLSNEGVANLGNPIGCKILAAAMHYSMLSTFTWFAVEAFHLCFHLIKSSHITIKHYILKVCIAGWALPCVVMIILFCLGKYGSLTINSGDTSVNMCWITDSTVHYVVNISYYAIVFLFTFTVFIVIMTRLTHAWRVDTGASKRGTGGPKNIYSILGLCCLLGITWGFAFFSHGPLRIPSFYIFTILNSFQGFYLFLYYYNTNKIAGEEQTSSSSTQISSIFKTSMHTVNPYLS